MRVRGDARWALIMALLGLMVGCERSGEAREDARAPEAPATVQRTLRTRTLTFPVAADTWVEEASPTLNLSP